MNFYEEYKKKMMDKPGSIQQVEKMATFETGATRTADDNKPDFEGYLSPEVLYSYAAYMLSHQGTSKHRRDSDNWQLGIPRPRYMKSMFRHFMEVWRLHRIGEDLSSLEDLSNLVTALNALLFNVMGYQHELLKKLNEGK